MCTLSRNISLISEISAVEQGEVTLLVAIVMSHPAKKPLFCLPCEKHFTHQKSLSEGGIALQHLKSLLLSPPWAHPLKEWEHSSLSSGKGMFERAQVPKCPETGAFGTISSHLGPYKSWGAVNSGLLICIHTSGGFFPLERQREGRETWK